MLPADGRVDALVYEVLTDGRRVEPDERGMVGRNPRW
jgi:hypothetical protein